MTVLFDNPLTLDEFLEVFKFGSPLNEGYPPPFKDYAEFLVYTRLPQVPPTLPLDESHQAESDLLAEIVKELETYWTYTRETAIFKVIEDTLKVKFGFCPVITYEDPPVEDRPSILKINIHVPDARACWTHLMAATRYYADYVPTDDEVASLTVQHFIDALKEYFNTVMPTQVTSWSYAIAGHRYTAWCSMAKWYEMRVITETENYLLRD